MITWQEAYDNEDNLCPRHTYFWALRMAKNGFHCVNHNLAFKRLRLINFLGETQIRRYSQLGFTECIMYPSNDELQSETWRLWKESDG